MALGILGNQGAQPNILGGGLPRIPWGENPLVTTVGLSLLGAPTLQAGLQNVAANAGTGIAAKTAMQDAIQKQRESAAETARKRAALNAGLKLKSGIALTPDDQAALAAAPEIALQFIPEKEKPMVVGADSMLYDPASGEWKAPPAGAFASPTDDLREYNFAKSQGFTGTFQDWQIAMKKAGATTVDARQMGTIPPGYKAVYDDKGNIVSMEPIPGGPADTSVKDANREAQKQAVGDIVLQDIGRALGTIEKLPIWTTGIGGTIMREVPGSSAKNVDSLLTTIKANIGFDRLQQMREASPTGGALGQVAVQELQALQSVLGSIEQSQDPKQLSFNLRRLYNMYLDIVHGPGNGPSRIPLEGSHAESGNDSVPEGIDPADWQYMTPEQKALFR
jgi:hypothetical protein